MNPGTGVIYEGSEIAGMTAAERDALVSIPKREFTAVRAMSLAERKVWAAKKVARREAAKRARKARKKSRAQ